jgi:hypothetical protein
MLRTIFALMLLAALALPGRLGAQMIELDNGVRIGLTGRLQVQYNTSSLARDGEAAAGTIPFSTFETRRARLGVRLELSDWIGSEIEAEFASRDVTLKYAFVNLGFDPRFAVRVGQFKKPFSLLELTSSTKIIPIERGLRIRGLSDALLAGAGTGANGAFPSLDGKPLLPEEQELLASLGYSSYELGVEVHGRFGRFGYQAGAFNGNGGNGQAEPGGHAYAGRLTFDPLPGRPLTLGAAASHQGSGTAFEVDAEWGAFRRPGLHVMAEAALGDNLVDDGTFSGAQVIAAVFKPLNNTRIEGLEPLFRVSYGNSSRAYEGDEGWLLTPGLNLYFAGRNRLMVNWEIFVPGSDSFKSVNALRAQAQIHF